MLTDKNKKFIGLLSKYEWRFLRSVYSKERYNGKFQKKNALLKVEFLNHNLKYSFSFFGDHLVWYFMKNVYVIKMFVCEFSVISTNIKYSGKFTDIPWYR